MVNIINPSLLSLAFLAINNLLSVTGQQVVRCAAAVKCPESLPCCSDLGFCGKDDISCKLSCSPESSFTLDSCFLPNQCQNKNIQLKEMGKDQKSRIQELAVFKTLPDPKLDDVDFFTDGQTEANSEGIILKMIKGSKGGSRAVTTDYLLYGNITANLKTGRTGGVVTSFITMSAIKDEIDFEWVGGQLEEVQTNIFYRGQSDYKFGGKHTVSSDTSQNSHEYKIEWNPEYITWYVDGKAVRTLTKKETEKNGQASFPSTPSRVEFGLWNGGSNAEGTKNWAGGEVDWDSEDIKQKGYFSLIVESLSIQCHPDYLVFNKSKPITNSTGSKSNQTNKSATNGSLPSSSIGDTSVWPLLLSVILVAYINPYEALFL